MRPTLVLALLVCAAAPLAAQTDKATILADWQRMKDNNLRYLEAMPESGLDFKPTPGVRSFAEQMEHIVTSNADVAAMAIRGLAAAPVFGDTTRFLHDKAALRQHLTQVYDYVLAAIREASPAQLNRVSVMYGQPASTSARWLQLAFEHSVWTLGQVVPYLRLKGATPPSYSMPF